MKSFFSEAIGPIIGFYIIFSVVALLSGVLGGILNSRTCREYDRASRIRLALPAYEAGCWLGSSSGGE